MITIRLRETGQLISEDEFRAMHENVSFPAVLDVGTLNAYDADAVLESPAPSVTTFQTAALTGDAVQDALGNWVKEWHVVDWSQEQIAAYQQKQTDAEQVSMSEYINTVRDLRERILNRLAGIGVRAIVANDMELASAIATSGQQLLDMTKAPSVLAATNRAELELAVKTIYYGIVQSTPEELRNAFYEVDE